MTMRFIWWGCCTEKVYYSPWYYIESGELSVHCVHSRSFRFIGTACRRLLPFSGSFPIQAPHRVSSNQSRESLLTTHSHLIAQHQRVCSHPLHTNRVFWQCLVRKLCFHWIHPSVLSRPSWPAANVYHRYHTLTWHVAVILFTSFTVFCHITREDCCSVSVSDWTEPLKLPLAPYTSCTCLLLGVTRQLNEIYLASCKTDFFLSIDTAAVRMIWTISCSAHEEIGFPCTQLFQSSPNKVR